MKNQCWQGVVFAGVFFLFFDQKPLPRQKLLNVFEL
jgi:hypothetical protein